jgi:hypothetical protein
VSAAALSAFRQLPPRRRHLLAAAALAAFALLIAGLVVALTRPPTQGPLADGGGGPEAQGNDFLITVRPGEVGAASLYTGEFADSGPAVLISIEPVHPEQALGLDVRYAVVSHGTGGALREWPVPGSAPFAEGVELEPGGYGIIWVGLSASERGRYRLDNFRLRYAVGGRHYEAILHETITLRVRPGA